MNIDNTRSASKIKTFYMLVPLLAVVFVAGVFLFTDVKDFKFILFAFLFLVIYFILMAIPGFYFVSFYAGPDKIRIRYKSLTPFRTNNNSIVIKSENFRKYDLKKSLFGKKKTLILYQETPGGLAKFPSVSLTLMNKQGIHQLIKALDLILALNKAPKP
ncbi:MAG: hypothetical protein M0P66_08320 [Salinivirgaceae bacterium]|nr:hypothetical protein [Salinivirgaceae bacterium]